jgi:hypothetical protein
MEVRASGAACGVHAPIPSGAELGTAAWPPRDAASQIRGALRGYRRAGVDFIH